MWRRISATRLVGRGRRAGGRTWVVVNDRVWALLVKVHACRMDMDQGCPRTDGKLSRGMGMVIWSKDVCFSFMFSCTLYFFNLSIYCSRCLGWMLRSWVGRYTQYVHGSRCIVRTFTCWGRAIRLLQHCNEMRLYHSKAKIWHLRNYQDVLERGMDLDVVQRCPRIVSVGDSEWTSLRGPCGFYKHHSLVIARVLPLLIMLPNSQLLVIVNLAIGTANRIYHLPQSNTNSKPDRTTC